MSYINKSTGEYPVSVSRIQSDKNILLPENPDKDTINSLGYAEVEQTEPPIAPEGKIVREGDPKKTGDTWVQFWIIEDAPKIEVVEVTAAQAQVALFNAGLLDEVEEAVANHPYPMVRIWWRAASFWRKDNPYVQGLAAQLGLTDSQVDDLFVAASKVQT